MVKYLCFKGLMIMLEKARPNLEIALAGAFSVLLALGLISSLMAWGTYVSTLPETQYLDSTILIQNHKGAPVGQAHVVVFELADGGPRKLSEGIADNVGIYRARLHLPRKLVREKSAMLERSAAVGESEARDIYASVNLWVVAYSVGEESGNQVVDIGTLTFAVDPTGMRHPLDSVTNTIVLSRVEKPRASVADTEGPSLVGLSPQRAITSSCQVPTYPYQEESWAYTTVLKFATWDNIWARYEYPMGSKIRVESKQRYFVISTCSYTSWSSAGSTEVTFDMYRASEELTGRMVYEEKFKFKYYFIRYLPPYQSVVLIEKVYAVDTGDDGKYPGVPSSYSWGGTLPSWSDYFLTPQNRLGGTPITGKDPGYSFSVGVSFSYYVGVSISLGVGKSPSPTGFLYIRAGTWTSDYMVKTVSKDGSYLETYSNWVPS
ncbi:MAG: hypothetical protein QXS66_05710 [Thermoproteota archaeon]